MTTISVRIEETEKEALQKYAEENDLTVSQVVRRAIKDYFAMQKIVNELNQIPN